MKILLASSLITHYPPNDPSPPHPPNHPKKEKKTQRGHSVCGGTVWSPLSLPPSPPLSPPLSPSLTSVHIFWWRHALHVRRGVREGEGRGTTQHKLFFYFFKSVFHRLAVRWWVIFYFIFFYFYVFIYLCFKSFFFKENSAPRPNERAEREATAAPWNSESERRSGSSDARPKRAVMALLHHGRLPKKARNAMRRFSASSPPESPLSWWRTGCKCRAETWAMLPGRGRGSVRTKLSVPPPVWRRKQACFCIIFTLSFFFLAAASQEWFCLRDFADNDERWTQTCEESEGVWSDNLVSEQGLEAVGTLWLNFCTFLEQEVSK